MTTRYTLYLVLILLLLSKQSTTAQEKHVVEIKVFDEQMKPFPNIDLSLNGNAFFIVGKNGSTFVELTDKETPPVSIAIRDNRLEAASWNYSKGVLQVVVRKKNYSMVEFLVRDRNNTPLRDTEVTFKGATTITSRTDNEGKIVIPVALENRIVLTDEFAIAEYNIIEVVRAANGNTVVVEPVRTVTPQPDVVEKSALAQDVFFKDFDLSQIDSIKSLTAFYAIFKNYHVLSLDDDVKKKLDAKLKTLVEQLETSSPNAPTASFIGRISDSSFVSDDIRNLLAQATQENQELDENKTDFDEKISIIRQKLEAGIGNLNTETREKLLADLLRLEQILEENENKFYTNQSHYRLILNDINANFLQYENLENRLSVVEAERLREQEVFRKKLLTILFVAGVFAVLLVLLVIARNKLRSQKKELVIINGEIKRINENLEALVSQRTKLLQETNKELDLFLYKASHDLRSPVRSIIGLGNLAAGKQHGTDPGDLFEKVVETAHSMDKLLNKLRIISEINQPAEFSKLDLPVMIEEIKENFDSFIRENNIELSIDCPKDLQLYSNNTLTEAVIFYLLENALFFCSLKSSGTPRVELTVRDTGETVEFSFYDNGIGIDRSIQNRIFEMFYIGNEQSTGNGLGLYIVAKCLHALKGNIKLESEVNSYTRFSATIPSHSTKNTEVSSATSASPPTVSTV